MVSNSVANNETKTIVRDLLSDSKIDAMTDPSVDTVQMPLEGTQMFAMIKSSVLKRGSLNPKNEFEI